MFSLLCNNSVTIKKHFEKKWLFITDGLSFDQELIYDFILMCVVTNFANVINNLSIYYTLPHTQRVQRRISQYNVTTRSNLFEKCTKYRKRKKHTYIYLTTK